MVLIAHAEKRARSKPMIILDKVRRENLPSVGDSAGARKAMGLSAGEGLLEPTYCLFGDDNVVAMLVSGNGPRAKRLCDYLSARLGVTVGLDPVLTHDLDRILSDMVLSSIELAIPATRINRELVGGDWVETLEASKRLAEDRGIVRVGVAVGRRGDRQFKARIRSRIRTLTNQLRGSGALSEVDSARVKGTVRGLSRTVDLMSDRFVEQVEVEADILNDPERSAEYAWSLLVESLRRSAEYLAQVVPPVGTKASGLRPQLSEPGDRGQRR
ncbi:oxidoreductase [Dietzia sp. CQ4]|uniref:oxidoreductase n=1 Tax=Dietzia sp. (strain CQ4) TaxID=370437 RepID=UPI0015F874DF|nr:oxidoreductase [Dietzia sp. CQ4]